MAAAIQRRPSATLRRRALFALAATLLGALCAAQSAAQSAAPCACGENASGMVTIRGGSFPMGIKTGSAAEGPVRRVFVADFSMGKNLVTVAEFRRFAEETGYVTSAETEGGGYGLNDRGFYGYFKDLSYRSPGFEPGDDGPALEISWHDAIAYCNWRSAAEGRVPCYSLGGERDVRRWPAGWNTRATEDIACDFSSSGYRLPTEAEWEYAASIRGENQYAWGNGYPDSNVMDASLAAVNATADPWPGYDDGFPYASPVGSFPPNEFGLNDMGGNAMQWCWDRFDGHKRAIRGASWKSHPQECACAFRAGSFPYDRSSMLGFRLASSAIADLAADPVAIPASSSASAR